MLVGPVLPTSALTPVGGAGLWGCCGMVSRTSAALVSLADGRACAFDSSIMSSWAGRYPGVGTTGITGMLSWFAGWRGTPTSL